MRWWWSCFHADNTNLEILILSQWHTSWIVRALRQHKEKKQQRILSDRMPTQFVEFVPGQTCPFQVEGQTFPSHLKQNKGTGNGIRSLCSRTRWESQIQIPTRSVHQTFQANGHESTSRCAFHISILPTRSHTCSDIRTEQVNYRGSGDLQSLWPASSENVLVNLLLLHCGHCLWDWTFPHGSRKQQTNVCTD